MGTMTLGLGGGPSTQLPGGLSRHERINDGGIGESEGDGASNC